MTNRKKQLKFYVSVKEFNEITKFIDKQPISQSKFFRLAVKEKIENIKNPKLSNTFVNYPEITKTLNLVLKNQEKLFSKFETRETMINAIKEEIKKEIENGILPEDLTRETEIVSKFFDTYAETNNYVKGHKAMDIIKETELNPKIVISILTTNSLFYEKNGRWHKNGK